MKIVFNLPSKGGGGGAHSVVQEALGMRRFGVEVDIAVTRDNGGAFRATYPDLQNGGVKVLLYSDDEELAKLVAPYDLTIATTALSASKLAKMAKAKGDKWTNKIAYYIQDYEPLFFKPGTPSWTEARASYDDLPEGLFFAKTDWLCRIVAANHNRTVTRVKASLDRALYYPFLGRTSRDVITIAAMIRPQTPRRAPRRTVRIFERLAHEFGKQVHLISFGCDRGDIDRYGLRLPASVEHVGVLSRTQVASVLRDSDLFLDLSDYQAFGRTGLEAMACGCVSLLPVFGGAEEYCVDRVNSFLVDTRDDDAIVEAVRQFVENRDDTRATMRTRAIETSLRYSVENACISEFKAFTNYYGAAFGAPA